MDFNKVGFWAHSPGRLWRRPYTAKIRGSNPRGPIPYIETQIRRTRIQIMEISLKTFADDLSVRSKYYFSKLNTIGTVIKQLIVAGLKIQFYS